MLLHTEALAFTRRNFYHERYCRQTLPHTDTFTNTLLYTQTTLLHTDHFTHRHFFTQKLWNKKKQHLETKKIFTKSFVAWIFYRNILFLVQEFVYTQMLVQICDFIHKGIYTQSLLYTDAFKQKKPCTQKFLFTKIILHKETFTHKHFRTQTLL